MECWRSVRGYEGFYEVSNLGRVRSLDRYVQHGDGMTMRRGKILSASKNTDGYLQVNLCKDGKCIKARVHKLVADAFVDGWFPGAEVDHKDCDRTNNASSNLQWLSHSDNVARAIENGNHICTTDMSGSRNPNYGNDTLRKRYAADKEAARAAQSRPRSSNGRATRIVMTNKDVTVSFECISDCIDYLTNNGYTKASENSIRGNIWHARKYGHCYLGFSFS